jgi:uncharacterized OB-fold protein
MTDVQPLMLPLETNDARGYWDGCRSEKLLVQRCQACGQVQFYPRSICTTCGSQELELIESSGRGVVFTFSVCHRPATPAYADRLPYVVALVDIEEGVRLMTNILDCDVDQVRIGMNVEVCFETLADDVVVPQFRPST